MLREILLIDISGILDELMHVTMTRPLAGHDDRPRFNEHQATEANGSWVIRRSLLTWWCNITMARDQFALHMAPTTLLFTSQAALGGDRVADGYRHVVMYFHMLHYSGVLDGSHSLHLQIDHQATPGSLAG